MPDIYLEPESLADVMRLSERADRMMSAVRGTLLAPDNKKIAPTFNASQVATLCRADRSRIARRLAQQDLPAGELMSGGRRRDFTLAETQQWVRDFRSQSLRPQGADAVTIAVVNFKGGVGKTTTTMTLGQRLSLLGHKVLLVDCDPQGSLTTLFGVLPATEVTEDMTILPALLGSYQHYDELTGKTTEIPCTSISPSIRRTYWSDMDLVCAAPLLSSADFGLPTRQLREPGFEFWNVLNMTLDEARREYDVILIDTPPVMSFVTVNAMMACDGVLMPLPPRALDVASAANFWQLFSSLASSLVEDRGVTKNFDFIRVLMTRVKMKQNDDNAAAVKDWIGKTYGQRVLRTEIPETKATEVTATEFGTVYDTNSYSGDPRTFKRAREAYDNSADQIEELIRAVWKRQLAELAGAGV